ncbi:hypothetical protein EDD37DRAFT_654386 [Exophiala viscosa]|uniref:uncharacterized protein n=1 Tax=Exophiala viscosa TaxID=2486360 RepID=UPI002197AD60|nr:hypothetical protein EDD37DRAFT_654386 [Exophiala viscosa]
MKFSSIFGVAIMAASVVGSTTAAVEGAKEMVIAALQAREVPANEIKAFLDLVPRDTVTVTTSACGPYGYTPGSYGPPASASVPATTGTTTPPIATTGTATPTPLTTTSITSTTRVTTTTTLTPETATTETPDTPPVVPGTTPVESTTPVTTTSGVGSTGTTPEISTGVNTPASSSVEHTTSSTTTETTELTPSTSTARFTPSTSTPPAPVNAGATSGIHVGLIGLVAVLALA